MTVSARDRRALAMLAITGILALAYRFWPEPAAAVVARPAGSAEQEEKRLARLREIAASVPAKEEILKKVSAELATREKGLIQAETAAQAQAQLIQVARKLAAAEVPPIEIRGTELGAIAPFGDAYGSVSTSLQMECRMEQLINLIAALASQPDLISLSDLRITSASPKDKTVGVRLTVTGVVPRKLVPERRGPGL
jgi:hypothetical protein